MKNLASAFTRLLVTGFVLVGNNQFLLMRELPKSIAEFKTVDQNYVHSSMAEH
jgi:hypothetical protein